MTRATPQARRARDRRQQGFITSSLLEWYTENARDFPWRRKSATRYRQVVSEVLLRRTRASTVAGIYHEFFRRFSGWRKLARAHRRTLERVLRPLGLWQERARTLPGFARAVVDQNFRFPRSREELMRMPGVGLYVASAILVFYHQEPEPLLDRNMARVLCRFHGWPEPADIRHAPGLYDHARQIVAMADDPRQINWAFLDLGATVCKPRPASPVCSECPLRRRCVYAGKKS